MECRDDWLDSHVMLAFFFPSAAKNVALKDETLISEKLRECRRRELVRREKESKDDGR